MTSFRARSDGVPLTNFHREQFGGSVGGHIIRDKLFYFGAAEGIEENLLRLRDADLTALPRFDTQCLEREFRAALRRDLPLCADDPHQRPR